MKQAVTMQKDFMSMATVHHHRSLEKSFCMILNFKEPEEVRTLEALYVPVRMPFTLVLVYDVDTVHVIAWYYCSSTNIRMLH